MQMLENQFPFFADGLYLLCLFDCKNKFSGLYVDSLFMARVRLLYLFLYHFFDFLFL